MTMQHKVVRQIPNKYNPKKDDFPETGESFTNFFDYIEQSSNQTNKQNYFFTLWRCGSGRNDPKFLDYFYADIDEVPQEKHYEVFQIACGAIGADPDNCALIASGGGIQLYIPLQTPIEILEAKDDKGEIVLLNPDKSRFDRLIHQINEAFLHRELPYCVDILYDVKRIFRLPGTLNVKPKYKEPRECKVIHSPKSIGTFDLSKVEPLNHRKNIVNSGSFNEISNRHYRNKLCIREMETIPLSHGNRHPVLTRLAWHYRLSGMEYEADRKSVV